MSAIEIHRHPSDRQLRQFASICFVALPILGWLWGANAWVVAALGSFGLVVVVIAGLRPDALKPLYRVLMVVTRPIGFLIGELALLVIYFGVFAPFGWCFRIIKRDALHRRIDREGVSYWTKKKQPRDVASYYRQS